MFRIRYFWNTVKAASVLLVLYNEFFAYVFLPLHWPSKLECTSPTCVKILLVADPQILGMQDSSKIAKWDCDRFLTKTFSQAFFYTNPDLLIFLGDQMDEGHISSDNQFDSDLNRFRSIFHVPDEYSTTVIYIPGDNDIGGEEDPILPHVVHRFDQVFDQAIEPVTYGDSLEFYKVNRMTSMFQEPETMSPDVIRIALSHIPVLRRIHTISKLVATSIKPQLILSGHDHDSVHISAPLSNVWSKKIKSIRPEHVGWSHYLLNNVTIHEIVVPTCSYRMGVLEMGYGFAQIDIKARTASFSILWLPQRLIHLFVYLGFLVVFAIILVCFTLIYINRRLRRLINAIRGKTFSRRTRLYP